MEKWMMAAKKADFNQIGQTYHVSPILARIMVNRGLKTDEEYDIYNLSIGIFPQEIQNILTAFLVILIALLAFEAYGVIKGES